MRLQETYKVVSHGVCSLQMMWFWWMRVRRGLSRSWELCRRTLEVKDFRLSRSKTEYIKCDFSATTQEEGDIRLDGQMVPKKDTFRYLGSML
jgi:hypothetical protein